MPRTLQEILDNAEALADAFEAMGEDDIIEVRDGAPLREVLAAVRARAAAEQRVLTAVGAARRAGFPWDMIGSYLGTSGEAARQRYSPLIGRDEAAPMPQQPNRSAPKKAAPVAKKSSLAKKAAPAAKAARGRKAAAPAKAAAPMKKAAPAKR